MIVRKRLEEVEASEDTPDVKDAIKTLVIRNILL
jgi:hypothetical protein